MNDIKNSLNKIIARAMPFIALGVFFLILIAILIVFSYILLIGGLICLVLFGIAYIKMRFFSKNKKPSFVFERKQSEGKVYEHEKS